MTSPNSAQPESEILPRLSRVVLALALAKTLFHFATYQGYGIFRDEMYFVACARHLDWGFVDHPPFAPFMMALSTGILGDSLFAVRFWPSLLGGLPVLLGALVAREFGGRFFAQLLAGVAMGVGPIWMAVHHDFSLMTFEPLFWTSAVFAFIRLIKTENPKWWIWFGVATGLGLLTKTSVAVLGFGLVVGLLFSSRRRHLVTPWLLGGGVVAAILSSPFFLWQWRHGWPQAEFVSYATQFKNVALSPVEFVSEYALMLGPPAVLIWVAGLLYLLFARQGRYRALGLAWFIMLAVFVTMGGKVYYLAAIAPVLMGAGAVGWESLLSAPRWLWARAAMLGFIVLSLYLLPLTVPILPPEEFVEFTRKIGVTRESGEHRETGTLPQHYADMHGWEELVTEVARVYDKLSPEEKAVVGIFGQNYGEAGAIDFYGPRYGLPPAISGHNSYWIWGPRDVSGEVLIVIGGGPPDDFYGQVEAAGRFHHRYVMPDEDDLTIWLCRQPKMTVAEIWPLLKHFN